MKKIFWILVFALYFINLYSQDTFYKEFKDRTYNNYMLDGIEINTYIFAYAQNDNSYTKLNLLKLDNNLDALIIKELLPPNQINSRIDIYNIFKM